MALVTNNQNCNTPVDLGSVLQNTKLPAAIGLATSIAASSSIVSNIILNCGYKYFTFGMKSTQGGTLSVQRYVDAAATIPVGAAISGSISADTALTVDSVDNIPYQSMIITVSNTSVSTVATISNCMLLLQTG